MRSSPPSHRHHTSRRRVALVVSASVALAVVPACGSDDDDESAGSSASTTPATSASSTAAPATSLAATPTSAAATTEPVVTTATDAVDDAWTDEVAAACDDFLATYARIPPSDGTAPSIVIFASRVLDAFEVDAQLAATTVPHDVRTAMDDATALMADARGSMQAAKDAASAGDVATADRSLSLAQDDFQRAAGALAIAGARCGDSDPSTVQAAALTIPTQRATFLVTAAFDSIWISERLGGLIRRIDPSDGSELASIEIADSPLRTHAADGRLIVRAADRYVAVDPATNQVVATLLKTDVGPNAGRSWAVDGAMWICDGQRLHRYDPTTFEPVTVIELGFDCGQVQADDELVIAWNYNEDEGESGNTVVMFVDAATSSPLGTVPLPVDVTGPSVLDESVFFPGNDGATSVVVDRTDWTVSKTVDLGVTTGGAGSITDGTQIFVPAPDDRSVLVVDAATFEVTSAVDALNVNALAMLDGSLWVVGADFAALQRFDDVTAT